MIRRLLLCGVALGAIAFASLADEPKEVKETKLKPTIVFRGSHSQVRRKQFEVITTEAGWKEIWNLHRGKGDDPPFTENLQELNIDFDTHYAIGIFTGYQASLVVTTFSKSDAVLIRFAAHGYQRAIPGDGKDTRTEHDKAKTAARADYCFVVLPKPVKTVVIEKDVRRELSQPPIWEEQKRFPAPMDK